MEIVIIGLPQSGKSSLFDALTKGISATSGIGNGIDMKIGTAKVPDERLDKLAEMYKPQKVIPAEIKYWDPPGMESGISTESVSGRYRNILQSADALLICIRAFESPFIPHIKGDVDPLRDLNSILEELIYSDLDMADNALTRLQEGIKKAKPEERPTVERQIDSMSQIKQALEKNIPVSEIESSWKNSLDLDKDDSPFEEIRSLIETCREKHIRNDILLRKQIDEVQALIGTLTSQTAGNYGNIYNKLGKIKK